MIGGFMKYLLFAGDDYYPCGGARDLRGKANSADELLKIKLHDYDWAHVFYVENGKSYELDIDEQGNLSFEENRP
jgi:hypothetical protein